MVKRIRRGLFGSITKYKSLWCLHSDWLIVKAISNKRRCPITELMHEMIQNYLECHEQNHKKQIEDLKEKLTILAAEYRKYQNRFGVIKD